MKIDKVLNEGNSKLILDIKNLMNIKFNYLDRGLIDFANLEGKLLLRIKIL